MLKLDGACPGLCLDRDDVPPKLLALDRLATPLRCDLEAFTAKTLVGFERYRTSVRATFAPPSWGGLLVRATWSAARVDFVDLEVQITASSVGELSGLEVGVASRYESVVTGEQAAPAVFVEARDLAASPRAFDEPASSEMSFPDITFFSHTNPLRPSLFEAPPGASGLFYAEMAHPDDVARRISNEPPPKQSATMPGRSVRYALFGLPLEKGVVLRARLRGCWIRSQNPEHDVAALYQEFLREPLPLGP
jgi:hypothetical protein